MAKAMVLRVGDIIYQIYVLTIEMTKLLNGNCLLLNYKSTTEWHCRHVTHTSRRTRWGERSYLIIMLIKL
jgi:hypothetical protein